MITYRLKRIFAMFPVSTLLYLGIISPTNAQSFNDVPPRYWAESFIEIVAANTMHAYRYLDVEQTVPVQRRTLKLVAVEIGQFGDRYQVVENLQHNGKLDPSFVFPDPATTPGRINACEFIQDLTGQASPCPLQESRS